MSVSFHQSVLPIVDESGPPVPPTHVTFDIDLGEPARLDRIIIEWEYPALGTSA